MKNPRLLKNLERQLDSCVLDRRYAASDGRHADLEGRNL